MISLGGQMYKNVRRRSLDERNSGPVWSDQSPDLSVFKYEEKKGCPTKSKWPYPVFPSKLEVLNHPRQYGITLP